VTRSLPFTATSLARAIKGVEKAGRFVPHLSSRWTPERKFIIESVQETRRFAYVKNNEYRGFPAVIFQATEHFFIVDAVSSSFVRMVKYEASRQCALTCTR
jgi:hypothetical protein